MPRKSTSGAANGTPRLSALRSPSLVRKSEKKRGDELNDYGAAGAAKQPAGEAMCCLTIWLAQPDFLTEGRVRTGDPLAAPHAEDSGRVTMLRSSPALRW